MDWDCKTVDVYTHEQDVSGSEEDMYQMDYSKLVVHLVAGMKEQQTQIEELKTQINNLKGE